MPLFEVLIQDEEARKLSHQGWLTSVNRAALEEKQDLTGSEMGALLSGNVWSAGRFCNPGHKQAGSEPTEGHRKVLLGFWV